MTAPDLTSQIAPTIKAAKPKHPAEFEALKYSSRFFDQPCLALFDRGGVALRLQETLVGELSALEESVDWLEEHQVALV